MGGHRLETNKTLTDLLETWQEATSSWFFRFRQVTRLLLLVCVHVLVMVLVFRRKLTRAVLSHLRFFFQLNLSNILFPARARKGPRSCQYCHNTMNKKLTLVTSYSYIFGSAEPLKESENETRSIRCDQSQDVHFLPSTRKSKQVQRRQLKLPRNYWRKSLCGGHAQPPSSWLPVHSLQHHCWWRN